LKKMKKTLTLMALIATTSLSVFAQKKATAQTSTSSTSDEKPRSYIGLSTGINNIAAFAGLTFEAPFSEHFSGKVGLGLGGWGVKLGIAGKYYKQYATSWSFGAGFSTASGFSEASVGLSRAATPDITETTKVNMDRANMLDLVAGKSWGRKVKFNLELGYSTRVSGGTYATVDKNFVLSPTSVTTLNILRPGGLIIGLGLTFRL
jgi:hypothetical protein